MMCRMVMRYPRLCLLPGLSPNPLVSFVRKLKYGEEVVVVSGLSRSGTSMIMAMPALDGGSFLLS